MRKGFSASERNTRNKIPNTSEGICQEIIAKDIGGMTEPPELHQGVKVQRLAHLWFHHGHVRANMSEDPRCFARRDGIHSATSRSLAIEKVREEQALQSNENNELQRVDWTQQLRATGEGCLSRL